MTGQTRTQQDVVLELIQSGEPIVGVLGSGGTGKTFTTKQAINKSTLIGAPTGIAALNISGSTLHRIFKLPIGLITDQDYHLNSELRILLQCVNRIIFDEIGMVRADILDLINWKCRRATGIDKPFGGIQVVMVGDFFQLEPIVGYREKQHYFDEYDTPFCFGSEVFKASNPKIVELKKVYRNSDRVQVAMLNSIRKKDEQYKRAIKAINNQSKPYDKTSEQLHLCCYKKDAQRINEYWYNRVEGNEQVYRAYSTGHWKENELQVPEIVKLKVGCKVLVCANDENGLYVNGDRAIILSMSSDGVLVKLENSGNSVFVTYNKWEKYSYKGTGKGLEKNVDAEYNQLPIKLGWAITVHAAQGLTLDNIAIDLGDGCFSHGQLYVALSRVRDLKNISLVNPIRYSDCIVNNDVVEFYKQLESVTQNAEWLANKLDK